MFSALPVLFADPVYTPTNNAAIDAANGKGGYDCTKSGFRQYLQENCYITVGDYTALIGTDLEPGYFHTDHELPED